METTSDDGSDLGATAGVLRRIVAVTRATMVRSAGAMLIITAVFAGVLVLAMGVLSELARAQRDVITADGVVTFRGILLLVAEVGIPVLAIAVFLMAVGIVAASTLADDHLGGRRATIASALARGLRRAPTVLLTVVIVLAGVGLAIIITPVAVVAGVVGLLVTPVARLLGRRWAVLSRWPQPRPLLLAAVPFALPVVLAVRWSLALPAAGVERRSARQALARSRTVVAGHSLAVALLMGAGVIATYGTQVLFRVVLERIGVHAGIGLVGLSLQLLLAGVPMVVAVVIYRQLAGPTDAAWIVPVPEPRLPASRLATSILLVVALAAGTVVTVITWAPVPAAAQGAVTFTVDSLGDEADAVPGNGDCQSALGTCTLRAAIDEIDASPLDHASIAVAVSGTILVGSPLEVTTSLDLDATGQHLVVSGRSCDGCAPATGLFRFTTAGTEIALTNLTFDGGLAGPDGGGAIVSVAEVTLHNVTFTGNQSPSAPGGAIAVLGGWLGVENGTFVDNVAPGGADIAVMGGEINVLQSTFVGGSSSSLLRANDGMGSIYSNIIDSQGPEVCSGSETGRLSGGLNLSREGQCGADQPATELGPLSDNGGWVPTVALLEGSTAIDRGNPEGCSSTDARGLARPQGPRCDVGAFEYQAPVGPTYVVDDLGDEPDAAPDDGLCQTVAATCTLRAAVDQVNAIDGPPARVEAGVDGTITVASPITLAAPITVTGNGHHVIVSGGNASSIFHAPSPGIEIELDRLTLADGYTDDPAGGAALRTVAELEATALTFTGNVSAAGPGGAVAVPEGTASFTNATFWANEADAGADVWVRPMGSVFLITSTLAQGSAGSVFNDGGYVTIYNSIVAAADGPACVGPTVGLRNLSHDESCDASLPGATVGLGTLAKRGGPVPTVALTDDSSAIDGVGPANWYCPATDARGIVRPQGDWCDIGSFELNEVTEADVALVFDPAVPTLGQTVRITATVSSFDPSWEPSGTVDFSDEGMAIGSAPVGADGTGSIEVSTLSVGDHSIVASYGGTGDLGAGIVSGLLNVGKAGTTVSLGVGPNPSVAGGAVALNASVHVVAPGPGPATGTVRFLSDGTEIGRSTLEPDGSASLSTTNLSVGDRQLTATYDGDDLRAGSASTAVTQTVGSAGADVAISASAATTVHGETVTFRAAVSPKQSGVTATGEVVFTVDGQPLATATLDADGVATTSIATWPVGDHRVLATYDGDGRVGPGVSSVLSHEVVMADTTVRLVADRDSSVNGDDVTFTATVTPVAPGGGTPVGTVVFSDGATEIGRSDGPGPRTVTRSDLTSGTHVITARYEGSSDHRPATSADLTHEVTLRPTTATLTVGAGPHVFGTEVEVTATVTADDGSIPSGPVYIALDDVGTWIQVDAETGEATGSFPLAASGPVTFTAFYWGGGVYRDAAAPDVVLEVVTAPTAVRLDGPATSVKGVGPELTATVTVPGQTTSAAGTVTFFSDELAIGDAIVGSDGRAVLVADDLAVGPQTLSARFVGIHFTASRSAALAHEVSAARTTTEVTASADGSVVGQDVTFTATVLDASADSTPSGSVIWREGSTELARTTVGDAGTSTFTTGALGLGDHEITAAFVGEGDHADSVGSVVHTVDKASTTVALSADVARPVTGQSVTYTAQVAVTDPGVGTPSGTVTFLGLSTVAVPVDGDGRAQLTVAAPAGRPIAQQFTARYSGDTDLNGSDGRLDQTIDPASTTATITVEATTVPMGTEVVIDVDVATVAPGSGRPTDGIVIIRHAGREIDRFSANDLPATRRYETPDVLAVGLYGLTAELTGATGFRDVTSASASVLVAPLVPTVAVSSSANPTVAGRALTIEVQVSGGPLRLYPTGTIRLFEGSRPLGSAPVTWLGSAWGARLPVTGLSVGERRLVASYESSSSNYRAGESAPLIQVVDPTPTSSVFLDAPIVRAGGSAQWQVLVKNDDGASAKPTGSVVFTLDGEPIGSRPVVSHPLTGYAQVSIVSPPLARGTHRVTATFVPTGDFGPSQATLDQPVETVRGTVELTPLSWTPTWGEAVYFTAKVVPPAGSALSPPTGTIAIDGGAGGTCTVSAVGGSCFLRWDDPGQKSITARYDGDAVYQAISSPSVNLTVAKRQPNLDASVSSVAPETGAPMTMSWSLTGPADGAVSSVLGWSSTCPSTLVGRCTATPSLNEAGSRTYRAAVDYAGDAWWSATRWSTDVVPVGCYPLRLGVVDTGGTLAATTTPNCGNGTGYFQNSRVTFTATPDVSDDPGFDWYLSKVFPAPPGDPALPLDAVQTVTVGRGPGQTELVLAQFEKRYNCATVSIGTERTYGAQGTLYPVGAPNCPTDATGKATFPQWTNVDGLQVGRMILGSTVTTEVDTLGESEFYGLRWGRFQPVTQPSTPGVAPTIEVAGDVWVKAVLGPRCYTVGASVDGPGTAAIETPMNCNDPRGTMGWTRDTNVVIVARPNADNQFVAHWGPGYNGERSTATLECEGCGDRGADRFSYRYTVPTGPSGSTAVPHRPVVATIEECWSVDIQRQHPAGRSPDSTGLGTVDLTAPNCPVHATGSWYVDGTQVQAQAGPEYDLRFGKWNDDEDHGREDDPSNAYRRFDITADTVMRPSFYLSSECHRVGIASDDPAWVLVSTEGSDGDPVCPHGSLEGSWLRSPIPPGLDDGPAPAISGLRVADQPLLITARAQQGDPLVGWVVQEPALARGRTTRVVGTSASVSMETHVDATASACVSVDPKVRFVAVDGSTATVDFDGGDFIGVWPAPDCPFADNAWKVGTTVEVAALADPRGYSFEGWTGATDSDEFAAEIELDGSVPTVPVTVSYQVVCHQLTLTHDAQDVTAFPEPNCPGADPVENRYIGATTVVLSGRVPGGKVWRGWTGDVVTPGKVNPAYVLMDADKSAGHRWRSKDAGEQIEDGLMVALDPIAVGLKKAVGVAALVLVEVLASQPPLNVLAYVASAAMGLEIVLSALGVPESVTQYLEHVHKTINLFTAGLTCMAAWSFSANGEKGGAHLASAVGIKSADQALNGAERARENLENLKRLEASRSLVSKYSSGGFSAVTQLEETTTAITKAKIGYAKLKPSVGRAGLAASMAVGVMGVVQNGGGIGWDDSADAAWTDWGGYTDCLVNSLPGYIALEIPDAWQPAKDPSSEVPRSAFGVKVGE